MNTEGKSVKDELFILGTLKLCLLKVIKLSTELTKSAAYVNAINLLINERQHFLLNLICLVGEQNHLWRSTAEEHLFVLHQWFCPIAYQKIKLETLEQINMFCPVGTNIWHIHHF